MPSPSCDHKLGSPKYYFEIPNVKISISLSKYIGDNCRWNSTGWTEWNCLNPVCTEKHVRTRTKIQNETSGGKPCIGTEVEEKGK